MLFVFVEGDIDETDEIYNNFYVVKALFTSCRSESNGFIKILGAEIEGGGIIPFHETMEVHLRFVECLSGSNFIYPQQTSVKVYGDLFRNKSQENESIKFSLGNSDISEQIASTQLVSKSGFWSDRINQCWPSDELDLELCAPARKQILFTLPQNEALCNRYWTLNLVMVTSYADMSQYQAEFSLNNVLITCSPNMVGIFNPILTRVPSKLLPGASSLINIEMELAERNGSSSLVKPFSDYNTLVRYGDCSIATTDGFVISQSAQSATCTLKSSGL